MGHSFNDDSRYGKAVAGDYTLMVNCYDKIGLVLDQLNDEHITITFNENFNMLFNFLKKPFYDKIAELTRLLHQLECNENKRLRRLLEAQANDNNKSILVDESEKDRQISELQAQLRQKEEIEVTNRDEVASKIEQYNDLLKEKQQVDSEVMELKKRIKELEETPPEIPVEEKIQERPHEKPVEKKKKKEENKEDRVHPGVIVGGILGGLVVIGFLVWLFSSM